MMNYEIFKEVVKEKFMDYMPEKFKGMELVAEPVEKVNVTLDGIILREEGRNISPTIYINDMYKKYQDCGDLEVSHHWQMYIAMMWFEKYIYFLSEV